jgi:hypothetical protein
MDIEDRAEKWARDHAPTRLNGIDQPPEHHHQLVEIIRDAYLAGSAQTQKDYVAHFGMDKP